MLAVVGEPVYHSLSPELFRLWGENYTRIAADDENDILKISLEHELTGINITSPFKKSLLSGLQNQVNKSNQIINTLLFSEVQLFAFNTDIVAVSNFLSNHSGKTLLLIGAGDIAEIIISESKKLNIKVLIYNRTKSKLDELKSRYSVKSVSKKELSESMMKVDIIFNISPKWETEISDIISKNIKNNHIIADAIYHKSPFDRIEIKPHFTGLDWLIVQGKKSYEIFNNKKSIDYPNNETIKQKISRKKPDNFILTGFMGSGKTCTGKLLAKKMNFKFIDTDELIEKHTELTVKDIFNNYGEEYFRKIESEIIDKLQVKNCIISTGGGALNKNSAKLKSLGEIIYLYADFNTCIARIENTDRPLLKKKNMMALYNERKKLYITNSDLVINSGKDKKYVTERLFREIDYAFGD